MNAQGKKWKLGAHMRSLVLLPAVVVALSLVFTGVAWAQTKFQADVSALGPVQSFCANGAYACGTANIAGYGAATWDFYTLAFTNVQSPCGSTYQAQTQFTLVSDPSSTLVVDEAGNLCGLGSDGAAYRGYFAEGPQALGHPFAIVGNWSVDRASTGQFSGFAGATGTDLVNVAGLHAAGSYIGTVG